MDRRDFLKVAMTSSSLFTLMPSLSSGQDSSIRIQKKIPKSGESISVIGLGTWITFNVGNSERLRQKRTDILEEFSALGGGMIDSSPMYGSAEAVVGHALRQLKYPKNVFSATKIWTSSESEGLVQFKNSQKLWGIKTFDLMQVHNLDGWQGHLKNLRKMKEQGLVRYVGVTTSHGRRHDELSKIMKTEPLDFVQLTYNMRDRQAEKGLLDLALEKKIAVIANRPFDGGDLMATVKGKALPDFVKEFGCENWAQYFLKFIVSHPALTTAIPATSNIDHLRENMGASLGKLPDAPMRERMLKHFAGL